MTYEQGGMALIFCMLFATLCKAMLKSAYPGYARACYWCNWAIGVLFVAGVTLFIVGSISCSSSTNNDEIAVAATEQPIIVEVYDDEGGIVTQTNKKVGIFAYAAVGVFGASMILGLFLPRAPENVSKLCLRDKIGIGGMIMGCILAAIGFVLMAFF